MRTQAGSESGKGSWHLEADVAAGMKLVVPASKQAQGTCPPTPAIQAPSSAPFWHNLLGRQLTKERGFIIKTECRVDNSFLTYASGALTYDNFNSLLDYSKGLVEEKEH